MLFPLTLLLSAAASVHAAPVKPILSRVQIQRLQELMADHGHDSHVDPDLAKALGLTKDKEPVTYRQLTMSENPQTTHSFQEMPRGGGLILAVAASDGLRAYRTNARQEVVAAVVEPSKPPAAIPLAVARKAVRAELAYWSAIADQVQ